MNFILRRVAISSGGNMNHTHRFLIPLTDSKGDSDGTCSCGLVETEYSVNHKGQTCIYRNILCQEGYCFSCEISEIGVKEK
jgi:hypothetical protein